MEHDDKLISELLRELSERQKSLQPGDSVLVQPHIPGFNVDNPIILAGYDHEQIDYHLKLLLRRRFVCTHVIEGEAMYGIYFTSLTDAGRRIIRETT